MGACCWLTSRSRRRSGTVARRCRIGAEGAASSSATLCALLWVLAAATGARRRVRDQRAGRKQPDLRRGGFAAVVGLLSWLLIAWELVLIAAELNVVLARRLWPRSLTGELLDADKQALRDSAHAAQLDRRQQIAVSFGQRAGHSDRDAAGEERSYEDG